MADELNVLRAALAEANAKLERLEEEAHAFRKALVEDGQLAERLQAENAALKEVAAKAAAIIGKAAARALNDAKHTEPMTPERKRQTETMLMFREVMELLQPEAGR